MSHEANNGLYYLITLLVIFGLFIGVGKLLGPQDERIFNLETSGDHLPEIKGVNQSTYSKNRKDSNKNQTKDSEELEDMGTLSKAMKTDLNKKDSLESIGLDTTSFAPTKEITDTLKVRTDMVVRYYKKPLDGDKVLSLKELGYYIHERPTRKKLQKFKSNAIYYGDSVRREDIMIIANHLRDKGIDLKLVEHSRYGDGWKSHSIEIGVDSTYVDAPSLTAEEIAKIVAENPFIKD